MNRPGETINIDKKPTSAIEIVNRGLARRYAAEKRFRFYGLVAICFSLLFLSFLFISIIGNGYTAFQQTFIRLVRLQMKRSSTQITWEVYGTLPV